MSITDTLIDILPAVLLTAALLRGARERPSTTTSTIAGRDISSGNVTTTVTVKIGATRARDMPPK